MAQGLDNLDFNIGVNVTGLPQLQKVQTGMARLDRTIKSNTSAYSANAVATNKWAKGALQQAGYQVGDYAVQVANGTSATQAFGQQASQLLGIFGPIGAVLGAVVAIYSALAVAAERAGDQTESVNDLADNIDKLNSSMSTLRDLQGSVNDGFSSLIQKFGVNASAAEQLLKIERQLAENRARLAVKAGLSSAIDFFGSDILVTRQVLSDINNLENQLMSLSNQTTETGGQAAILANRIAEVASKLQSFQSVRDTINSVQESFGLARHEAETLLLAAESIAGALTLEEQVRATQTLVDLIASMTNGLMLTNDETDALVQALIDAVSAGLEFESLNLDKPILDASAAARVLASELDIIKNGMQSLSSLQAQARGLQRGMSLDQVRIQTAAREAELAAREAGITGASELAQIAAEAARIERETIAAEGSIKSITDALNELNDKGGSSLRSTKDAVDIFGDSFDDLDAIVKQVGGVIENSMTDAFMSVIDNTKNTADAFRSMARSIIAELYKVLVVQQMVGSVEKGTGIAGFIGKALGMRASGGQITSGQPYIVGEKGPELIVPSRNAHVVPNNQLGGGSGVTIIQNNTFGNGVNRAEINAMLPKLVEASKAAVLDAKRRGGSYGGAF